MTHPNVIIATHDNDEIRLLSLSIFIFSVSMPFVLFFCTKEKRSSIIDWWF